jgi:hypothetical protein
MATENSSDPNSVSVGPLSPTGRAVSTAAPPQFLLYREAFDQALPAAMAISEDELVPVNLDVPSAVATALGALPKIMTYREEASKLHGFDVAHFDQLQLRIFAVGHAHAKFLAASAPPEAIAALNERGIKLRDTMYHDAVALTHRGLIGADRIEEFKANVGYKNLAFDLLGLATLLRENWGTIASRTGVQLSELDEAELLGRQLMDAVGAREQAGATVAQVQEQRQRSFTLFSRSYDQVRRAIGYLRWDDEIEEICPSLYAGRGGRRKEAPPPTKPVPDMTTLATGSGSPSASTTAATSDAATSNRAPAAPGVGLPNGNPFATDKTS